MVERLISMLCVALLLPCLVMGKAWPEGKQLPTYRDFVLDVTNRDDERVKQRLRLEKRRLGEINLPSGGLVAADPLTLFFFGDDPLLKVELEAGTYPIDFYVFDHPSAGKRVALAQLTVSDEPVTSWKQLKNYVGVDAGLSSFMSVEAFEHLKGVFTKSGFKKLGISNYYDDVMAKEFIGLDVDAIVHSPPGRPDLKIAVLHSGFGDGFYPNYVGMDASGKPSRVVTTFNVLEQMLMPEGQDDPEKDRMSEKQFDDLRG